MTSRALAATLVLAVTVAARSFAAAPDTAASDTVGRYRLSEAEWRRRLSPLTCDVLRGGATERAFTGRWWNEHRRGTYRCMGCGLTLFASGSKFESGSGWPSFWRPVRADRVATRPDTSLGMLRTELVCARCGGHLGHVFDDGPKPTGLRYCINSAALDFVPAK